MKRLFWRPRMAIRVYRRPLLDIGHPPPAEMPYEEVFVILDQPLLEFTQNDLLFLRKRGIDPFKD